MANPAVRLHDVQLRYGATRALDGVTLDIPAGCMAGFIGPDGVGKSSLLALVAGARVVQQGRIEVLGGDMAQAAHRRRVCPRIAYMPQGLGKNLYPTLSVEENLQFFARLFGHGAAERRRRIDALTQRTGLAPFLARPAGKLSGGMKQKLGLACALMARPEVLLLDEPGVGVDPVSRQDLWRMVGELTQEGMAVLWSTAYLDEAERCESILLLNEGRLEYAGEPGELTRRLEGRSFRIAEPSGDRRRLLAQALDLPSISDGVIQGSSLRLVLRAGASIEPARDLAATADAQIKSVAPRFEDAFVDLLGGGPGGVSVIAELMQPVQSENEIAVSCTNLTRRFGDFTATDRVSFEVRRGEIFGLLGPNGAGKSTTFKLLCGLLKPSEGTAHVVGLNLARAASAAKSQLGYMAQKFSLYGLLSVRQNLEFSAGVYGLAGSQKRQRIDEMIEVFELDRFLDAAPDDLSLGYRQRLALACALMHRPSVLFLDEPTSGVDPITRREFWTHINGLARKGVTIMVTTHFMDEAEYCDRVALMYRAKLIALDTPDALKRQVARHDEHEPTMEDAFIGLIERVDTTKEAR